VHSDVVYFRRKGRARMGSTAETVVCVTGGSGYLASWLVRKLLGRGCVVHATLRSLGACTNVYSVTDLRSSSELIRHGWTGRC
jgi:hypothetical protein